MLRAVHFVQNQIVWSVVIGLGARSRGHLSALCFTSNGGSFGVDVVGPLVLVPSAAALVRLVVAIGRAERDVDWMSVTVLR